MTKFENIQEEQTLEALEKDIWTESATGSHLVKTCHKLRKKPLKDLEIEDLRALISQNIGLKFLIPLALEKLSKDILSEGDYYKGDLLKAVLTSETKFWTLEPKLNDKLIALISENEQLLNENAPELLRSPSIVNKLKK